MSDSDFEDGVLLGMYYGCLATLGDQMKVPRSKIEEALDYFSSEHKIAHTKERGEAFRRAWKRMEDYGIEFEKKFPNAKDFYQQYKKNLPNKPIETIDLRGLKIDEAQIKAWADENEKEAKEGVKDDSE